MNIRSVTLILTWSLLFAHVLSVCAGADEPTCDQTEYQSLLLLLRKAESRETLTSDDGAQLHRLYIRAPKGCLSGKLNPFFAFEPA
ncbi:MAG: hypothetical protein HY537_00505 [Deltaproteobacteria bacterium]|nr:hypothetical protein [Deltaproteobacteria bacterium]